MINGKIYPAIIKDALLALIGRFPQAALQNLDIAVIAY
jgi:hypothetical protein